MIELIYHSRARFVFDQGMIDQILDSARVRNAAENITGVLFFDGQNFIQILEGPEKEVEMIYTKIAKDKRHENVEQVYRGKIFNRSFEDWSMGYKFVSPLTDQAHDYNWAVQEGLAAGSNQKLNPGAQFFEFMRKNFLKERQDF